MIIGRPLQRPAGGEPACATRSRSGADATARDRHRQMRLAGAGPANQDDVALLRDEAAAGEIAHQALVDRCTFEFEAIDILGQGQFGDGRLILDRARLLLEDLSLEQIAREALRFVLAFERRGPSIMPLIIDSARRCPGLPIGSAAEEPMVCRLSAGGGWIRTSGTAAKKPWISAAFRALRGIGGALKRYHLMVQPFFFCASNHSIEPGGRKRRPKGREEDPC